MAEKLSNSDLRVCLEALPGLYGHCSTADYPNRLLPLLHRLVPCEHISYNDFDERRQCYIIRSYPERPEIQPLVGQLAHFLPTHPLFEHYSKFNQSPLRISDVTSDRQFQETAVYREYFQALRVKRQMIAMVGRHEQARIALTFNRGHRDFSGRDCAVLSFLSPHIAQAYRNALAFETIAVDMEDIGAGLTSINRAVILAQRDGKIRWMSPLAGDWLKELFPENDLSAGGLPAILTRWLNLGAETKNSVREGLSEMHLPSKDGGKFVLHCGETAKGELAIGLVREHGRIKRAVEQRYDLTSREGEILHWLSESKTYPETAMILNISVRTVEKHVEHILQKLGVENRLAAQRLAWELRRV